MGGADVTVLQLNRQAAELLADAEVDVIPGAGHLFEEPGALQAVAETAARWFVSRLGVSP
ncbi:MAG: hypothetical protein H0V19_06355 [Euzebyales bacterium]|nr:hypothetical protein [Euzebyales bacterium]